MTKNIDAFKIKHMRIRLLTNLNLFYPSPVRLDSLYRTVCDDLAYNRAYFQKDINYFHQKDYVEFIDERIGGSDDFFKKVVRLTCRGKEIAEGTQADPALEI